MIDEVLKKLILIVKKSGLIRRLYYFYLMKLYPFFRKNLYRILYIRIMHFYNSGDICNIINDKLKYIDLESIKVINPKLFPEIALKIYDYDIKQLKNKSQIRIGFLVYSSSMWACEKLYWLFAADERFEPIVLIRTEYSQRPEIRDEVYHTTLRYFEDNKYNVIGVANYENDSHAWTKIGVPDIIFHQVPYVLNSGFDIRNVPLTTLNVYIPYSISVDAGQQSRYNTLGYQLSWKVFLESEFSRELYSLYSETGNKNAIFSGYPKMDIFYENNKSETCEIWKIPDGVESSRIIKIIYAPHHSIGENTIQFSTFNDNYQLMFEYAKNHPETTSWTIKPHPSLKLQSIQSGIFKNESEYDDYLNEWDKLPNARSVREGPYFDLFQTSDGMILDSVSFLSEYQYVGKPLLLLTRNTQKFTVYGEELIKVLYTAKGSDMGAIAGFINSILINKNDKMQLNRKEFFEKYLDYKKHNNGILASEYIYQYIKKTIDFQ